MAKVIIVYVKLLGEATDVRKPVEALSLRQGLYKILPTANYDSQGEEWEFPPGSVVRILEKDENGKSIFIARDKNSQT